MHGQDALTNVDERLKILPHKETMTRVLVQLGCDLQISFLKCHHSYFLLKTNQKEFNLKNMLWQLRLGFRSNNQWAPLNVSQGEPH